MKDQLQQLSCLIESLPSSNSCRGVSDLNVILTKYKRILDYVNNYNDNYKSATFLYYHDINSIRDSIEISVYSESSTEKTSAFENAKDGLKKNVQALLTLIRPQEELVSFGV